MCRDPRQGHGRALASGFELILETNVSDCDATKKLLITNMEKAANLDVPLEVDVGLGNNWDQAH